MRHAGATLRATRESARLSIEALAYLLGVNAVDLARFEEGDAAPDPALLDRAATIFGVTLERLLDGQASSAPAALLFRSAVDHGADLRNELEPDDLRLLGDFLVCATEVESLSCTLGAPPPLLPELGGDEPRGHDWQQGQEFAARVRQELALGDDPIPSMQRLLADRLRWALFFITPDLLSRSIEGASTRRPHPAILVNLIGGPTSWWHTRVTLAHEMGHILFDEKSAGLPYILSPEDRLLRRRESAWALVDRFRSIERRANAFAVHLLAPGAALRRLVGVLAPDSEAAIDAACATFGIGRVVAIRRLGHEFGLSEEAQSRMLARGGAATHHERQHPDAAVAVGLRSGRLLELVANGLAQGQIGTVRARSILRVPMTAPLPELVGGGAPLVSEEHLARSRAEAFASQTGPCWAGEVLRTSAGWEVTLHSPSPRGTASRVLRLSTSFEPVEP